MANKLNEVEHYPGPLNILGKGNDLNETCLKKIFLQDLTLGEVISTLKSKSDILTEVYKSPDRANLALTIELGDRNLLDIGRGDLETVLKGLGKYPEDMWARSGCLCLFPENLGNGSRKNEYMLLDDQDGTRLFISEGSNAVKKAFLECHARYADTWDHYQKQSEDSSPTPLSIEDYVHECTPAHDVSNDNKFVDGFNFHRQGNLIGWVHMARGTKNFFSCPDGHIMSPLKEKALLVLVLMDFKTQTCTLVHRPYPSENTSETTRTFHGPRALGCVAKYLEILRDQFPDIYCYTHQGVDKLHALLLKEFTADPNQRVPKITLTECRNILSMKINGLNIHDVHRVHPGIGSINEKSLGELLAYNERLRGLFNVPKMAWVLDSPDATSIGARMFSRLEVPMTPGSLVSLVQGSLMPERVQELNPCKGGDRWEVAFRNSYLDALDQGIPRVLQLHCNPSKEVLNTILARGEYFLGYGKLVQRDPLGKIPAAKSDKSPFIINETFEGFFWDHDLFSDPERTKPDPDVEVNDISFLLTFSLEKNAEMSTLKDNLYDVDDLDFLGEAFRSSFEYREQKNTCGLITNADNFYTHHQRTFRLGEYSSRYSPLDSPSRPPCPCPLCLDPARCPEIILWEGKMPSQAPCNNLFLSRTRALARNKLFLKMKELRARGCLLISCNKDTIVYRSAQ